MKFRLFILLLTVLVWIANGLYSYYVNRLRLTQYKKVWELRQLRRENAKLYWEISRILNYRTGLQFAKQKGFVPVKPYRVFNFYPYLKGKPLIDFYFVWFGDTPSKIAKKLGIPLKELIKYNPGLRWGYVFPGQVLIYPVHFPRWKPPTGGKTVKEKTEKQNHKGKKN
jgi:hypothetical protein